MRYPAYKPKPQREDDYYTNTSNSYKFHHGDKVRFTDEAIKEGIYKDYMTLADTKESEFFWVSSVNNYPDGDYHTGQWIKTPSTGDDWIDSYWFERYIEPKTENKLVTSLDKQLARLGRANAKGQDRLPPSLERVRMS